MKPILLSAFVVIAALAGCAAPVAQIPQSDSVAGTPLFEAMSDPGAASRVEKQ